MSRHRFSLVDLLGKYCAVIISISSSVKNLRTLFERNYCDAFDSKYCIVIVNEKISRTDG